MQIVGREKHNKAVELLLACVNNNICWKLETNFNSVLLEYIIMVRLM